LRSSCADGESITAVNVRVIQSPIRAEHEGADQPTFVGEDAEHRSRRRFPVESFTSGGNESNTAAGSLVQ